MITFNLVRESITKTEKEIALKDNSVAMEKLFKDLDLEIREIVQYQEQKSIAFAMHVIDLETANFLYRKISNWSETSLAERITLTQLFLAISKRI